jgi:hypothetical protein
MITIMYGTTSENYNDNIIFNHDTFIKIIKAKGIVGICTYSRSKLSDVETCYCNTQRNVRYDRPKLLQQCNTREKHYTLS